MKVCGIIAEYNPFHNGHNYQLDFVRSNYDAVIAVMSGSFVQRGDVAVCDKWTRAKMALSCGVDLVLELPAVFALGTAERFAFGSVSLLDQLGIVDALCFGSENGDLNTLARAAAFFEEEPPEYQRNLKNALCAGLSYPAARQSACPDWVPPSLLSSPNNILGIEYLRQLIRRNSRIEPLTLKRHGAGYHEPSPNGTFASASAIRARLAQNNSITGLLPPVCETLLKEKTGQLPYRLSFLDNAVLSMLRIRGPACLERIFDVNEGLENRILESAQRASSLEALISIIQTRRYVSTRIRRILLCALLGIHQDLCEKEPDYIRVLGMTKTGQMLIKKIKEQTQLPIVVKTADYQGSSLLFQKDLAATDLAALCCPDPTRRLGRLDFTTSPVIFH